jgi:hypothetical protein
MAVTTANMLQARARGYQVQRFYVVLDSQWANSADRGAHEDVVIHELADLHGHCGN